jgi:glycosyltransferase involved in cell wall biosynthesis
MTPPLVSIIIPTYNYGHLVGQAVESALAQTYSQIEVIVVDDGSTDNTAEQLRPYGSRIRVISQANQGLSAARNTGIREARGEWVALLDSDDAFHPRKIERQLQAITAHPELALIGTSIFSTEPPDWATLKMDVPPTVEFFQLEELVTRTCFAPSSALLRKDVLQKIDLFDTELRSVEDRDMWIRVGGHHAVGMIREPLTWYRQTPGSMSRNPERMELNEHKVLAKAFAMPELQGRWLLRRKAYALTDLTSGFLYFASGQPSAAALRMVRSLIRWPIPFRRPYVHESFVRVRLLFASVRRMLVPTRSE